ncbi:MAG: peptidoglycan DD-metalloendopeptidase family protein [Clostridia bacterium]|nr:peptidoglycan DD-metalloendopeptidase family protein [Clostridia bacterium]
MSKHRERSLDVVSGIDEELVDKATATRIRYFKSGKRPKKLAPVIAIAAALAVLLSLAAGIIIANLTGDPVTPGVTPDGKQVPVYTGMSVSHADGQQVVYSNALIPLSAIELLDNENTSGNNGNHSSNNPNKKPIEDIVNESDLNPASGKELYYAKPGETIRITIHFDNPDQFEILSFTLNGAKYGIQMFLEGSDMENLIVEYTIPEDAEGITECTIDAIKYIDGEVIKDVKIGGDRTVKIGVYSEKQPAATVENETKTTTDISFDVTVSDELGLIGLSEGKLLAVLVDKAQIVDSAELTVGERKTVSFTSLDPNKYYRCAVVGVYDAFDGEGVTSHILYEAEINAYKIIYDLDGGENDPSNPSSYMTDTSVIIESPRKENAIFIGWTFGEVKEPQMNVEIPVGSHGDLELKAHWKKLEGITAIVDGGEIIFKYSGDMHVYYPGIQEYRAHSGVDISGDIGDPVYAALPGEVIEIWDTYDLGYSIAIDHGDGHMTVYRGISKELPEGIEVGAYVSEGQIIATIAAPCGVKIGTAPHVHFELLYDGVPLDPTKYFESAED